LSRAKSSMKTKRRHILLVEDNPADARLIREYLGENGGRKFVFQHADIAMYAAKQVRNTYRCYSREEST
jgi:CheY-like chemotaxis protein